MTDDLIARLRDMADLAAAKSFGDADAASLREAADALEAARDAVPTNWCDPALTGPTAVIGNPPYGCPDIERLLLEIRRRITGEREARNG